MTGIHVNGVTTMKHALTLLAAVLGGAACSSTNETGSGCDDSGAAAVVTATGTPAFVPNAVTIQAGQAVCWRNDGAAAHTVTSDDGTTFAVPLGTRTRYEHTFATAGSYPYSCEIHPGMTGTVTVQ
jgi:plastocyanin